MQEHPVESEAGAEPSATAAVPQLADPADLTPLPYHRGVRDYLKTVEAGLWELFSSTKSMVEYADALRLEILKSTYRFDRDSHQELHAALDTARQRLGIDAPVTLYQSQGPGVMNARIYSLPGEAHIVLHGQLLDLLTQPELLALLGHELTHFQLWRQEGGEFLTAYRLLGAMVADSSEGSHASTLRRFQQYLEIHADRGALHVSRDVHAVVASLVKIETGLKEVNAANYIRQADEILASPGSGGEGETHPPSFLRARALTLWNTDNAAEQIRGMIEIPSKLRDMDLFEQVSVTRITEELIGRMTAPPWIQSEGVLALRRMYFPDAGTGSVESTGLAERIAGLEHSTKTYLAYVLVDFLLVDRALEDLPLAAALRLAEDVGLVDELGELVRKELKMTKKALEKARAEAVQVLAAAVLKSADGISAP